MNPTELLSQNFLVDLYLGKQSRVSQPVLQILGFQVSEHNPKEIIIRLSDGSTFFDGTLLGPYDVVNNKITVSPFTAFHGTTLEFKKFDLVKIVDFFSKIDPSKICRLKMMIRRIVEFRTYDKKINRPQDLAFYAQINRLVQQNTFAEENLIDHQRNQREERTNFNKYEPINDVQVKIYEDDAPIYETSKKNEKNEKNDKKIAVINKELHILGICKDRNPDQPLTCRDVMNGFDGFFIGKLMRMKPTIKQGKDNSTNMLALGFLDLNGQLMKLNLLGKMAIREEKELKIGRCYYLKGLQLVQNKGSQYIRLREKDYKMHVLNDASIISKFSDEYYHWQHEFDYIENENVDVIGVIEDVEEKTSYGQKEVGDHKESKQVIRVVIRNKFKTVKVSFWSDQLKNLSKLSLKKGEVVIIEDVRKKKLVFLDFANESTVIRLHPDTQHYKKLIHLLPQNFNYASPINIESIYKIQQLDKYNTKVHTINAYLIRIQEQKIIFKMCDLCKKKININSLKCFECKASVMSYKYNTNIQFGDYSGSLWLSVYDSVAEKLFGFTALRLKQMKQNQNEYSEFVQNLYYRPYRIGLQIKNEKFILRNVEEVKEEEMIEWSKDSVKNIGKISQDEGAAQSK